MDTDTARSNMDIWTRREKTDPAHTKQVSQRGGFTAIDAYYQFANLTEEFGPVGKGWGYSYTFHLDETLLACYLDFWYIPRDETERCCFPSVGAKILLSPRKEGPPVPDKDAHKSALTDAITKAASMLGFNADVFLGMYDDKEYVAQMNREFADPLPPETQEPKAQEPKAQEISLAARAVFDEAVTVVKTIGGETLVKAWLRERGCSSLAAADMATLEECLDDMRHQAAMRTTAPDKSDEEPAPELEPAGPVEAKRNYF